MEIEKIKYTPSWIVEIDFPCYDAPFDYWEDNEVYAVFSDNMGFWR